MQTAGDTPIHLSTPRLILRLGEPADVEAILDYYRRNAEFFAPTSPPRPADFVTAAYWHARLVRDAADAVAQKSLRLFLFGRGDPARVIGTASLSEIVRMPLHACYLGYALDEREQGKGLMHEALQAVIDHAFHAMNLHRLIAGYVPTNQRSARVLRRLGFVIEGYARDYLYVNGAWHDHVLTGLVNPDWRDPT